MIRSTHLALVARSLALSLAVSFASLGAVALSARPAFAQDQAAVDKLVQMNKKALDDYDTLDWDAAKRILLDALVAGKKAGLDNHPVMGRTYIHLGAIYITGFHNRDKGMQSFARALEIDPSIQLSKGIETAEVTAAFAEAQRNARGGGASSGGGGDDDNPPPPPKKKRRGPIMEGDDASSDDQPKPRKRHRSGDDEPDLPAHIGALDCPEPDEAIIDKPLTVRCALAPNLPVASVYLMYRAPDKETYNEVLMTKTPKGWLQAKIPKKAVTGKSIQFYFEGRNAAGKPVVANGGADSPNIALVVEEEAKGEASEAGTGQEPEENPLDDPEENQRRHIHLGHADKEREGLDTRYGKRKWWIGIGIGSGYGYAKGNGFEAVNKSTEMICAPTMPSCVPFRSLQSAFVPGLAFAGLGQLEPEFGYAFNPGMALAVTGRLQYTGIPSKYSEFAARGAIGVLAKLLFYTKQSQLRFYFGPLAGGGNFRFVGYPDAGATNAFSDFKDTIDAGPLLVGALFGVYYEASKTVSLVGELNEIVGLPTIGAVTDINVGLQFNLYSSTAGPGPKAYVPTGSDQEEPK
jgi:hypothetical protein